MSIVNQEHQSGKSLRLLIVAALDHTRNSLAAYLQLQTNLIVVEETATAADALHLTQKLTPDVVVMDVNLPDMDGFAATRRLRALACPPAVILLAIHLHMQDEQQAINAGAVAYLEKSAGVDAILTALNALALAENKIEKKGFSHE